MFWQIFVPLREHQCFVVSKVVVLEAELAMAARQNAVLAAR
jgi:hypothetical protein